MFEIEDAEAFSTVTIVDTASTISAFPAIPIQTIGSQRWLS